MHASAVENYSTISANIGEHLRMSSNL